MAPARLRSTRTAATVLAAGLLLTACAGTAQEAAGGGSTSTAATRDETVIIGTGATPQSLEPAIADEVQTDFTVSSMYDKLVTFDGDGNLVPQLATEWEFGDDAASVTLTLRDDVTFHSGNPFTAADVVYTLDRVKKLGLGVASFVSDYESAEAVDDTHVTITMRAPNAAFVGALSKVYVLDSALVAENAGSDDAQQWLATNDAGSGAYTLSTYTANQTTEVARYADYWDFDDARPAQVVYRYITESGTLRDELTSGGIDVATGLAATDVTALEAADGLQVESLPSMLELFVMFNTQGSGMTSDPKVREAIQLAYDYDGHIASILQGKGQVASGLAAPSVGCRYDAGPTQQDVARAKELLDEAGATGKSVTMVYQQQIPEHAKAATLLQSNLADIGLTLELQPVTYPEYVAMLESADTTPDLGLLWDFPYYPEIGPMLYRVYDSQFIDQTNYARYANPEVDELLESGLANPDPEAACQQFVDAQKLIVDDHVAMTISNPENSLVLRDGLAVTYDPTSQLFDVSTLVTQ